jgi:hypothetical protein
MPKKIICVSKFIFFMRDLPLFVIKLHAFFIFCEADSHLDGQQIPCLRSTNFIIVFTKVSHLNIS